MPVLYRGRTVPKCYGSSLRTPGRHLRSLRCGLSINLLSLKPIKILKTRRWSEITNCWRLISDKLELNKHQATQWYSNTQKLLKSHLRYCKYYWLNFFFFFFFESNRMKDSGVRQYLSSTFCTSLKLFSTYPQKEMERIPNNIPHVWRQAAASGDVSTFSVFKWQTAGAG